MTDTDVPTFVRVPVSAPKVYWEGWAEDSGEPIFTDEFDKPFFILRTFRTGSTGRSDAQFIVDRLASGLHFALVVS